MPKISVLPDAATITDADLLPIVQAGVTSKVNVAGLRSALGSANVQSLVDLGYVTKVWEQQLAGKEAIYSSPIGPVTTYLGTGGISNQGPAIMHVGWDWYLYARSVTTGAVLWRRAMDGTCYGRPQSAIISGLSGGYTTHFAPCHAGYIRSFESDGVPIATFQNVYTREGTGTATARTTTTLTDSTKSWAANAFIRSTTNSAINAVIRFTSGPNAPVGSPDANGFYTSDRAIISSPGGNTLTVASAWATTPNVGDPYVIVPRYSSDKVFMHAGTLVNESGTYYLYCTGFDNHLYKLNASTLSVVWKYATLENMEPYPLVFGGYVYCVSIDGNLRKFSTSGTLQWTTATGQCDAFLNAVDVSGTTYIYVSSRDNRVYRVVASSGAIDYQSTDTADNIFGDIDSSALPITLPGVTSSGGANIRVLTGGDSGGAWSFRSNLETAWQQQSSNVAINSSPIAHNVTGATNGMAFLIGDMRGTLFCYDAFTGAPIGRLYHKGGIEGWPLYADIDGDGKMELVVTTIDGWITCWRFTNGGATTLPGYPSNTRWAGHQ
jgi:hypothetical protein